MDILHQVVTLLLTLALLIAFHEYGHFWVARRCGVKVLQFSIGFGPKLFSYTDKKGTQFSIAALPLGGFVKMLDEREMEVAEADKSSAFNGKPVLQRIAIVSAGPLANFLLAILVYWLVFLGGTTVLKPEVFAVEADSAAAKAGLRVGDNITAVDGQAVTASHEVLFALLSRIGDSGEIILTTDTADYHLAIDAWLQGQSDADIDVLQSLGFTFYQPEISPVVGQVLADSAAATAGLQAGDVLLAMDGELIDDWRQWVAYVQERPEQVINLRIQRPRAADEEAELLELVITPQLIRKSGRDIGQVGIAVVMPEMPADLLIEKNYSLFQALAEAGIKTWQTAVFSLSSVKKLLTGALSYKQLSGPISIAKVASQSAQSGIYSYLSLLALLSVSLGVLNLLPIPVLDGGHIMFYLIEWVKGSPVPEKLQLLAFQLGMAIVLSIMVLAVVNDISRL